MPVQRDATGGSAPRIRVLEIRGTPPVFSVRIGKVAHVWEIDGLGTLVETLNLAFRDDAQAKELVLLGEWEDMLQVWAVPKALVGQLLGCDWFKPANRRGLIERGRAR